MLRQNINLYSAFNTVTPELKYLNWRQLVLATACFLFLLVLSYLFDLSDLYYQKYRLTSLNNNMNQLQAQFESKKSAYPAFFFSENVAKVVSDREKSMQLEAELLQKIANHVSFSDILTSLAEIDVLNVWLTEISISEGGNNIKLSGNALSMPDLKSYFAQIEKNIAFKNDHLTIDKIEHSPKDNYPEFQTYIISIAKTQNEKSNT